MKDVKAERTRLKRQPNRVKNKNKESNDGIEGNAAD
jgi:hypothetical protein